MLMMLGFGCFRIPAECPIVPFLKKFLPATPRVPISRTLDLCAPLGSLHELRPSRPPPRVSQVLRRHL